MIPHILARAGHPDLLQLVYDFDAKTTTLRRCSLVDGAIAAGTETQVPRLLRAPISRGDSFYVAVMDRREFGAPAFVERWSWDDLERRDAWRIDHPRFGLTGFGVSPSGALAVLDRFFPTDDDPCAGARVVTLPELRPVGEIPINAGMSSPVFDSDEERVAMVHYDQSGCSANVYRLGDAGAELLVELASRQIVTDFERACVAFLPDGNLAVWSVKNWSFEGTLGLYDLGTGEARFVAGVASGAPLAAEEEELAFLIENTELAMLVGDDDILVGAVAGVVSVDRATGETRTTGLEGAGAIVQLRRCADRVVAIDHDGALFVVPRA